ncbi:MAG: sigma-70 family RNA polymerase sigma factor [Phycisphaerales bacterium]|nr:sigma-70 family RNA polymerase sigma factor [Phycisphaerales bacterium]
MSPLRKPGPNASGARPHRLPRLADPEKAVAQLLDAYGQRIHAVAFRITGNDEDADDVSQEAFLQAYRKWDQFRGEADPGTWLYTIAVRAARRALRRRISRRQRFVSLEQILPFGDARMPPAPIDAESGEAALMRSETVAQVDGAIAGLPVIYRLPVVLKDIAELSVEEVASVLGIKGATVKTRVHRGRLLLRRALTNGHTAVRMPPPAYERQMCLDLLRAKMEALDRGVEFPVQDQLVCERCKSVFGWLDLARDACQEVSRTELPPRVRELVMAEIAKEGRPRGGRSLRSRTR